jgi:hypothetical protein
MLMQEGPRGLAQGVVPRIAKVSTGHAVIFFCYDQFANGLGLLLNPGPP